MLRVTRNNILLLTFRTWTAFALITKAALGSTLLLIPYQFKKVGWAFGITVNVIAGALCLHGLLTLVIWNFKKRRIILILFLVSFSQFNSLYLLCKKHQKGYIPFGMGLYWGFKEGPEFSKRLAVPSCILVNSIIIAEQFSTMCVYYEVVCRFMLGVVESPMDDNYIALCVFPVMVIAYFVKNSKVVSIISILADILMLIALFMVIYVATSVGIGPKTHEGFRDLRMVPTVMSTFLFNLETTGVVSLRKP